MIYESEEGQVKVCALFDHGTIWLPMEQMCQLFGENEVIIGGHLTSIYAEGELREAYTLRRIVDDKPYYSLDVVLAVGFRVRSRKGQKFRIWAMKELREQILK